MKFGFILFGICVLIYPMAQILLKMGMMRIGKISSVGQLLSPDTLLAVTTSPYIIGGVLIAIANMIFWMGALSSLNVGYLNAFGSLSLIILAILACLILGESITLIRWIGICTITIGCVLINQ